MAAAATLHELPPVTTLRLVPNGDVSHVFADVDRLIASQHFADASVSLHAMWHDVRHEPELALRQRLALAWCNLYLGELDEASEALEHADGIVQLPRFDAADRAEVLFRQGCVALKRGAVGEAATLLTRALDSNDRAPRPRLALAARAHEWRARCHVWRRDWDAATADVERSIELATAANDVEAHANALFQASIATERQKQWLLARCYAEQALGLYTSLDNRLCVARVLNNLGGIDFLLGDVEAAEEALLGAIDAASQATSDADLAQAVNSLAQVYLRTDRPAEARARALRAVELLESRTDFRDELGNAQLVIAGSYTAEGEQARAAEWLAQAEQTFASLGSTSHLAAVWVAQGDLARAAGDVEAAADLFRQAADVLQDVHF